ncbi:hypothetical protein M3202_05380 [Alkalihalobacillus oceani]|uniref:DUF2202 domain-containing protein n=1 Tax=Halalkalibacter oceani TaxID=1653776 RepID=A0A9X2DN26_9BACI|nr:hypothetical protein [Halalkalibacter oceani]MCM3713506.1 hypothetical protein [Halalkalibacter oceani]
MFSRAFLTFMLPLFLLLFGCAMNPQDDLMKNLDAEQHKRADSLALHSNNTDQNKVRGLQTNDLQSFASEVGYYLSQSGELLQQISPYFDTPNLGEGELDHIYAALTAFEAQSEQLQTLSPPPEFNGFFQVQMSTLIEARALADLITAVAETGDMSQLANGRIYYENVVMAHKLMEREYLNVSEEHGLY